MSEPRAFVKNAADKSQVLSAAQKEKFLKSREDSDFRFVLSSVQGRRFIKRLLNVGLVGKNIWKPSAEIHRLAGIQEVGNYFRDEAERVDIELYFRMEKESKLEQLPEEENQTEESNG